MSDVDGQPLAELREAVRKAALFLEFDEIREFVEGVLREVEAGEEGGA